MIAVDAMDFSSIHLQLGMCYAAAGQIEVVDGTAPSGSKVEHFQKLFDKMVHGPVEALDFATGKGYATGLMEATSFDKDMPANMVGELLYKALDCDHTFKGKK